MLAILPVQVSTRTIAASSPTSRPQKTLRSFGNGSISFAPVREDLRTLIDFAPNPARNAQGDLRGVARLETRNPP
jgi:hypothetical protein